MLTLRLKRLMTTFLQRCTWTTKYNVIKMYLCSRMYFMQKPRTYTDTAMNDEGQMKDNLDKICIFTFSRTNYYYYCYFTIGEFDFLP